MITDGILGLFYLMFEPLVHLLPDGTFPDIPSPTGLINILARFDYVFPFLAPAKWLIGAMGATALGLLGYRLGIFIYTKVRG